MVESVRSTTSSDQVGQNASKDQIVETSETSDGLDFGLLLKNQTAAGAAEPPPSANSAILRRLQNSDPATLQRKVLRLQKSVGNKSVQRLLTEYQIQRRLTANLNLPNLTDLKETATDHAQTALGNVTAKADAALQNVSETLSGSLEIKTPDAPASVPTENSSAPDSQKPENKAAEAAPSPQAKTPEAPAVTASPAPIVGDAKTAAVKNIANNVPGAAQAQAEFQQAKGVLTQMQNVKPSVAQAKTEEKKPAQVHAPAPAEAKTETPDAKQEAKTPGKDPQLEQEAKAKPENSVKPGDMKAPDGVLAAPKGEDSGGLGEGADQAPEQLDLDKPFEVKAGTSDAGEIQRVAATDLEPPKLKPTLPPEQDPAFVAVKQKTVAAAKQAQDHEPAKAKADEAQAAAVPPANEVSSQAGANQVGKMNQQEAGEFDKPAFIAAVRSAVEAITPKNEDEADKFKESGKAGEVKSKVSNLVGQNKETAEKNIDQTSKEQPSTDGVQPKQVVPMQPEKPGDKPADVGAEGGMPKPKEAAETSLDYGPNKLNKQMTDAKVTEEQLQKSNEPTFKAAVDEKKKVEQDAATKPQEFRQNEKATLDQAKSDAKTQAGTALDGMQADRTGALGKVTGDKDSSKTEDEQVRAKLAADLDVIYNKTKTDVTAILDGLDGKVDSAFTTGEEAARKEFEDYVKNRMDKYKDERYGGLFGWANRVVDAFAGMPPEVNAFYSEGRNLYLSKMDTLISNIADIVGNELKKAKTLIAEGLQKSKDTIAEVAKKHPDIAREAQEEIQSKYDELKSSVDDKQKAVIDSLAQKYVDSTKAIDDRIKQMQEENKGLVAKAVDAVKGVIDTILELKDMLLGVLARAAAVIDKILADPIAFLSNLINAIKAGLGQFLSNILTHLQNGLVGWLTGALGQAGLKMPANFDLQGILDLVLQITGLTYQNIRSRVVKATSEKFVSRLEKAAEIIMILITKGPIGLWEYIQAQAAALMEQVISGIKDWVTEKVITAGINWLISTFNPAGAFIAAARMIVSTIQFIMERGSQIMSFVNSILDSVEGIANGNIGGAANAIENSLAKALPLAISFCANLLGLGGVSEKIKNIIAKVQKPVNNIIDKVINGVLTKFKSLFKKEDNDKYKKLAKEAATSLGKSGDKPRPVSEVKPEKEKEAKTLETNYAAQLEPPAKISINFENSEAVEKTGKLEFTVSITPNNITEKGAIRVLSDNEQVEKALADAKSNINSKYSNKVVGDEDIKNLLTPIQQKYKDVKLAANTQETKWVVDGQIARIDETTDATPPDKELKDLLKNLITNNNKGEHRIDQACGYIQASPHYAAIKAYLASGKFNKCNNFREKVVSKLLIDIASVNTTFVVLEEASSLIDSGVTVEFEKDEVTVNGVQHQVDGDIVTLDPDGNAAHVMQVKRVENYESVIETAFKYARQIKALKNITTVKKSMVIYTATGSKKEFEETEKFKGGGTTRFTSSNAAELKVVFLATGETCVYN